MISNFLKKWIDLIIFLSIYLSILALFSVCLFFYFWGGLLFRGYFLTLVQISFIFYIPTKNKIATL